MKKFQKNEGFYASNYTPTSGGSYWHIFSSDSSDCSSLCGKIELQDTDAWKKRDSMTSHPKHEVEDRWDTPGLGKYCLKCLRLYEKRI